MSDTVLTPADQMYNYICIDPKTGALFRSPAPAPALASATAPAPCTWSLAAHPSHSHPAERWIAAHSITKWQRRFNPTLEAYSMKQVEFNEPVLIGAVRYEQGDRKSFADDEADEYVRLGWATDVLTGETGERVPGSQPSRLQVDNIVTVVE